jgi:hypothetical protein
LVDGLCSLDQFTNMSAIKQEQTDLHCKVECHEFATAWMSNISREGRMTDSHWSETSKSSADCEASKAHFRDRSIDDTFLAKLIHEAFCNLHEQGVSVESFATGGKG